MESEDFIGLPPVDDNENAVASNQNLEPRKTEIQQNSICSELSKFPANGCAEDCRGTGGDEYQRHSHEEEELDNVNEIHQQQNGTEMTITDSVMNSDVVQQVVVVENGCTAVDSLPTNGHPIDCDSTGVESKRHSLEMEADKVIEIKPQEIIQDCAELTNSSSVVEKIDVQHSVVENGCAVALDVSTSGNCVTDGRPISGVKRDQMTFIDQEPCIHVAYNFLTRESIRKLKECLQQWSEWHARHETSTCAKDALEHGEETFFPALHVGEERSSMVTFWVDSQPRNAESKEKAPIDSDFAPLYDRGYVLGSNSIDGSTNLDRLESLEASRCFNCGSYSHSLKECPRPRDNEAINSARKQRSAKKNPIAGARGQSRYYVTSPGKFDDLKPGFLGPETRECLGIGEFDPPPWLHRMREIGYPPGYLNETEDEDQPSGITIFEDEEVCQECEEGELPGGGELSPPEKKMSVQFPGINAPIPENADHQRWKGSSSNTSGTDTWRRYHQSSNSSPDIHRSYNQDSRRSRESSERGLHTSDSLPGSLTHGYSSRYSPYDRSPIPRSPTLPRSHSDRWRSPLGYEGSPGYGYQTPSHYSPRDSPHHHSSVSSFDRWDPYGTHHGSSSSSLGRDRDRYDYHYHHR